MSIGLSDRIILALDMPDAAGAFHLLESLGGLIKNVKVGPGLFLQEGPALVRDLQTKGYRVFLDLKLHDIPNTVALGVKAARKLGVWMLSVHLSGGKAMLEQAARAAGDSVLLAGITVLTSMDDTALTSVGVSDSAETQVKRLAQLGKQTGLKAVVASPKEVKILKSLLGAETLVITPGIRSAADASDDQSRTMTAADALAAGADYLVIGRPVIQAPNPKQALEGILNA